MRSRSCGSLPPRDSGADAHFGGACRSVVGATAAVPLSWCVEPKRAPKMRSSLHRPRVHPRYHRQHPRRWRRGGRNVAECRCGDERCANSRRQRDAPSLFSGAIACIVVNAGSRRFRFHGAEVGTLTNHVRSSARGAAGTPPLSEGSKASTSSAAASTSATVELQRCRLRAKPCRICGGRCGRRLQRCQRVRHQS